METYVVELVVSCKVDHIEWNVDSEVEVFFALGPAETHLDELRNRALLDDYVIKISRIWKHDQNGIELVRED